MWIPHCGKSKASKVAPAILNVCTKISISIIFGWVWNSGPSGLIVISLIIEGDIAKPPGLTPLMAPMIDMELMTRWQDKDETSSRKEEPENKDESLITRTLVLRWLKWNWWQRRTRRRRRRPPHSSKYAIIQTGSMKIRCEDMFSLERIKIVKLLEHTAPDKIQSWEAPAIENSDSQQPTWNYRQWQWWRPPAVENPKISFVILGLSDQPLQPIRHLIHQIFKRVEGIVCLKWDWGAGGRGHHYGFDLRDTLKDHLFQ